MQEKLTYLHACLPKDGDAMAALSGFDFNGETYDAQIEILKRKYGDKSRVLNQQLNTLLNRAPARNLGEVGKLVSFLHGMKRVLAVHGIDFKDPMTSMIIMATFERKLPADLSMKWQLRIEERKKDQKQPLPSRECATIDYGSIVDIEELLDWLDTRVAAQDAAKKTIDKRDNPFANKKNGSAPQADKQKPAPPGSGQKQTPKTGKGKKGGKGGSGNYITSSGGTDSTNQQTSTALNAANEDADNEEKKKKPRKEKQFPKDIKYFLSGCIGCGKDGHIPPDCADFLAETLNNKWHRIGFRSASGQFCYRCFDPSHKAPGCKDGVCGVACGKNNAPCQKNHHPCLHKRKGEAVADE
jgi:hypothetical protein